MAAQRIDGKLLAAKVKAEVAKEVSELNQKGIYPRLVVFLVGEDPASAVYVKGKEKDCGECGIQSDVVRLPADTTTEALLAHVGAANADAGIHGILVQLPLPKQIDERLVLEAIDPRKDVDGFHPVNVGRLHIGEDCLAPCTPAGCMVMLGEAGVDLTGKQAVVVGRSNIVGKPIAAMLVAANATVTVCHTRTADMAVETRRADVLVAAAGVAKLITGDMVKAGAVVIDVGMNRDENGKLCGDVDYASVSEKAAAITPVPGGVGLMTRAMLMQNTLKACKALAGA